MLRRLLDRIYTLPLFMLIGRPLWWLARRPALERLALRTGALYGWSTTLLLGGRRPRSVPEMAARWQRLMPRPRGDFPVVEADDDTALMEIRIHCPLRGSGDTAACWRAMSFDRALARRMGARLVVMESQSSSGASHCRLALRRAGADMSDLPVAHPAWRHDD